eukprot:gnl/MRDRNA2_/MRDRNA2_75043_c0_seq1.p1 gnl/MRDRNA2_/MRDRNA2_75043_c0~~gnl/MRDRNA2_/MRDRNA2_75043_c0_seq1.p1  ORF type:complete len:460 (-),score=79.06 gnl/MRDRNA2_/MRDRNA2_75043_c0_seq1:62-1441(-)
MAIAEYTLWIALAINSILFTKLVLPEGSPIPAMADLGVWTVCFLTGTLYFVLVAISFLITIILYSPLDHRAFARSCSKDMKLSETIIFSVATGCGAMGAVQVSGSPVVGIVLFLVCCNMADGKWTTGVGKKECPNNPVALSVKTLMKGLSQKPIVRRLAFSIFGGLALTGRYFFYPFLLLDLIFQKPMLENVMKAITIPFNGLVWTGCVGCIIMYSYAIIGFYMFRHDFDGDCESVPDCTTVTIYQGFRADIGSAIKGVDPASDNWYARMTYDLSYFIVMTTLFMNVLSGMVIDTFGSLRDETSSREEYQKNYCFISSLDRGEVDKVANSKNYDLEGCSTGYDFLENVKQHRWNYLNFIFYLKRKSQTDFSGPESKIFELLGDEDTTWFPIGKCIMMAGGEADADDPVTLGAIQELFGGLESTLADMQEKMDVLEAHLEGLTPQVQEMYDDFSEKKDAS